MSIKLLKTDEAAELLGIRPWTLRGWVSEGRVPYVKLGRLVRFDDKRLEEWIAMNCIEPRDSFGHAQEKGQ
jgi:excisionase family DNA binding protein